MAVGTLTCERVSASISDACVPQIVAECRSCGAPFTYQREKRGRRRLYCGSGCSLKFRGRAIDTSEYSQRDCSHCGVVFTPSKSAQFRQRFCSPECKEGFRNALRRGACRRSPSVEKNCAVCGRLFRATHGNRKHCSSECRTSWANRKFKSFVCIVCGAPFSSRQNKAFCCSPECARVRSLAGVAASNALQRKYVDKHEKWQNANARRRAVSRGVENISRREIFQRDKWRCGLCGKAVDRRLVWPHPMSASLDHILPLSEGGVHSKSNVQCSHLGCNSRKQAGAGGQYRLFG